MIVSLKPYLFLREVDSQLHTVFHILLRVAFTLKEQKDMEGPHIDRAIDSDKKIV